ncbi:hypothetical protein LCGC14_0313120 [marine sediment metagenome]|uniref:Acylneuraminate cytidylyltransferase n=1 Tax=marine sediment metagenome TaxID=412755 RepID=A0A0F9TLL5_9ZZZZ
MNTVAIIQARMGSSRLPGKVLQDVCGKPMLQRVYERVKRAELVGSVVVATSFSGADQQIVRFCQANDISVLRGGHFEGDVLGRYADVATITGATVIVRITADCPLIDPGLIDEVVAAHAALNAPYLNNVDPRTYPDGLDVEAFTIEALRQADRKTAQKDREHVTTWLRKTYKSGHLQHADDLSALKWSVDTEEDMEYVRGVYAALGEDFGWLSVLGVVRA